MRLNTGNAFEDVGNYQKQKGVLELSLKITEQHYGPEDPKVARSPYRLGHAVGNLESCQVPEAEAERIARVQTENHGAAL